MTCEMLKYLTLYYLWIQSALTLGTKVFYLTLVKMNPSGYKDF